MAIEKLIIQVSIPCEKMSEEFLADNAHEIAEQVRDRLNEKDTVVKGYGSYFDLEGFAFVDSEDEK